MPSSVLSASTKKSHHPGIAGSGVLEIKLKQKLALDPQAVVYRGMTDEVVPKSSIKRQHKHRRNPKVNVTLENLAPDHSFKKERGEIMEKLSFPSPTRQLLEKQVGLKKTKQKQATDALPPVAGAFKKRQIPPSNFPSSYNRGHVPVCVEPRTGGNHLKWTKRIEEIDYAVVLPLFFEGTREKEEPYHFLASTGTIELLQHGRMFPEKVHACLHKLIAPIRIALNTRDMPLICETLKNIQLLLDVEGIGPALVPYYRQLLPGLNTFKNKRHNLGDAIDFSQRRDTDVGALIQATLEKMERIGGPDAYVNIKYMVPTYEGINN
ncbi:hypothetical protein SDRG_00730 [Saprolegnia diclina VS20]|uniref:Uncharacterized protein n=1 Tax=Saprolegnia diclina (strain VS20) TaxID=1156394 RepID=T0QUI6_SAPDV|nr:hypothetical protein SDRG_00730 [Saprolegnia diclina VS20]EQC41874.1 hypothetical protein SDRG_00730 [Saprolegnia diclina VS20]|eukprot:XP_008604443.1 hypothetical protein SDRG_00730 [Saprolegnia diclina VS20]